MAETDDTINALMASDRREGVRLIMATYHGFLTGLASRILNDSDGALDLTQQLYISLCERGWEFRGDSAVRTYLAKTVLNGCRDILRKRKRRARIMTEWSRETDDEEQVDAESAERLCAVREQLYRLPVDFRVPLQLCVWEGLTYDEIASALGIPLNTVRTRIARARMKLGNLLLAAGVTV
jgi:RNA polymerase sigma-70 factor, ECF subfamily